MLKRLALSAFLTTTLFAQTPAPQVFRSTTDLVPVDVRVLDKNGKPITGLQASDFTILEDGVPQTVKHFSHQQLTPSNAPRTASAPATAPAGTERAAPGPAAEFTLTPTVPELDHRIFLIVLGRGRAQRTGTGIDGAIHFVRERLMPQDLVAVLAWDRATEFTNDRARILDVLQSFKREHEKIESAIEFRESGPAALYQTAPTLPPGVRAQIDAVFGASSGAGNVHPFGTNLGPNRTRMIDDTNRIRDRQFEAQGSATDLDEAQTAWDAFTTELSKNIHTMEDLSNIYTGIEYLRPLRGEKHLVFISASGFWLGRLEDGKDLASAASNARVAIDYFHSAGTTMSSAQAAFDAGATGGAFGTAKPMSAPALPDILNDVTSWAVTNAELIADMTGGAFFVHHARSVAAEMDRLDDATRSVYVLGYYPSNPRMDSRYRTIKVIVNRPGSTMQYRHGYLASPDAPAGDAKRITLNARIAAAAQYVPAITDIKVHGTASLVASGPTERKVQLEITIDPTRLRLEKRDGATVGSIEIATFVVDGHDHPLGELWKTVDFSLTDDQLEAVKREGAKVRASVLLRGTPKKAKVIVYDAGADLVGSTTVDVK